MEHRIIVIIITLPMVGMKYNDEIQKYADRLSISGISSNEFDGRGNLVRERIMRYDIETEKMITTQDMQYEFDLE